MEELVAEDDELFPLVSEETKNISLFGIVYLLKIEYNYTNKMKFTEMRSLKQRGSG